MVGKDSPIDLLEMVKLRERSSMSEWFPLIKDCGVPMPETYFIMLSEEEANSGEDYFDPEVQKRIYNEILRIQREKKLGYPFFMRTGQTSAKHSFEQTCFVAGEDRIIQNLNELISFSRNADAFGLPCGAIVVRRFIPLAASFTAFLGMPVAPERRFFVRKGEVECCHPYWPGDSIRILSKKNWRELLRKMNTFSNEIPLLGDYARKLGARLPGYWSIDFALGKDGVWYFIDAACGEISYHDLSCRFSNQK